MTPTEEKIAVLATNHRVAARDHRTVAQALTDISTGLYNKSSYEQIMEQAWSLTDKALEFQPKGANSLYAKLRKVVRNETVNIHFYVAALHEAAAFALLLGLIKIE